MSSENFAEAFSRALLDPDHPVPLGVTGSHGKASVVRFGVYRNNVTVSLVEALAAIYPATKRIVGEDFFRAMARSYVRLRPPSSRLLFEYGAEFPSYIEDFPHASGLPWLADVARIERAWLDAYHAADACPMTLADLAKFAPEQLDNLSFTMHPATAMLRSAFPSVAIFAMNRADGTVSSLVSDAAEDALITRPDGDVEVRLLPHGHAVFLESLLEGATLGSASALAIGSAPSFDLSTAISGIFEAGAFVGAGHGA